MNKIVLVKTLRFFALYLVLMVAIHYFRVGNLADMNWCFVITSGMTIGFTASYYKHKKAIQSPSQLNPCKYKFRS